MGKITYSLGGINFDAVPEKLEDLNTLKIASRATLSRAKVISIGTQNRSIVLTGKFISPDLRSQILSLFEECRKTGIPIVFNDGYIDREVLIRSFETVPIVGKTEGYSFKIELVVI